MYRSRNSYRRSHLVPPRLTDYSAALHFVRKNYCPTAAVGMRVAQKSAGAKTPIKGTITQIGYLDKDVYIEIRVYTSMRGYDSYMLRPENIIWPQDQHKETDYVQ